MSQFNELLAELETLAKAQPADGDQKIAAAAAEGGAGAPDDEDDEGEADPAAGNGEPDGDEGKPMAKSFRVTMPDGTEQEAVDGTALVKSLGDRLDATT